MFEREGLQVSAGRWASIIKEQWQQTDLEHGVLVPMAQAGVVAGAVGLSSFAGLALVAVPLGIAAGIGGVVGCGAFTWAAFHYLNYAQERLLSRETWESETAHQGSAEKATLRVEWVNPQNGHMLFEELGVSHEMLGMIARPGTQLSRRGLCALGLTESKATSIMAQLLELGYAARINENTPAYWTSKGRAVCRAYSAGGVVGGASNTSTTSETQVG